MASRQALIEFKHSTVYRVCSMGDKVKTTIVVDRELWEEFRSKVAAGRGLKALSSAVEEAIEEEVCEKLLIKALGEFRELGEELPLVVTPVKPKVKTDAGEAVRELRESRC